MKNFCSKRASFGLAACEVLEQQGYCRCGFRWTDDKSKGRIFKLDWNARMANWAFGIYLAQQRLSDWVDNGNSSSNDSQQGRESRTAVGPGADE
jgi:hypothetical protein